MFFHRKPLRGILGNEAAKADKLNDGNVYLKL